MTLTFFGGARSVTGANYLLEVSGKKYLIDCGMIQGSEFSDEQNYQPFPYNPGEIEAVLLTHAHVDHLGLLPKLCKEGFEGKIYSTIPTKDLASPIFEDTLGLLLEQVEKEGKPMLYGGEDVQKSLTLFEGIPYGKKIIINEDFSFCFRDAGHVLGSAIIEIWAKEPKGKKKSLRKVVFSGDLGNPPTPLLRPTEFIKEADYVVIESTYGNRLHEDRDLRKSLLEDAIEDTIAQKGVLMMPAFALERTQELLYEFNELVENHRIPLVPIFIDSPLAIKLTDIYKKYPDYFNDEARSLIKKGDELFNFSGLRLTKTVRESKEINGTAPPKIIVAGSGMSNGGRILHHERRYLSGSKNLLLILAWQAAGSLGRRLLDGEKRVKIFDESVEVKCKIQAIGGYSAHPDQQGLMAWIKRFEKPIRKVFVVQGEEEAALALVTNIQDNLGIEAAAPMRGEKFEL